MDGIITHSFGPHDAEYILGTGLLKVNPNTVAFMFGAAWDSPGSFSVYHYHFNHLATRPSSVTADNHALLFIDFVVNWAVGSIVRQRLWRPHTQADQLLHVANARLCLPIFFIHSNGMVGVPLADAIQGRINTLRRVDESPDMGNKSSTQIRVGWLGYKDWQRQIQIKDETPNKRPITLRRLVQHIGRAVDHFFSTKEEDLQRPSPDWRINGHGGITREEIIVLGVIHVSSGSWMPLLQVTRNVPYVTPPF
ncbi:hypothetical protein DENSPDRAFT_815367 [Dentipellis sp. KUC8613]|nr:hypothetical protein DENSPDRAFT_815367 [Dentipellis sp. KUC8613]